MLRRSDIYFYNICVFEYNNDSMLQAGSQSRWCFPRSNCIKSAQSDCHINQLLLQISYSNIFFCNKLLIVYHMDFLIMGVITWEAIIFVWNNVNLNYVCSNFFVSFCCARICEGCQCQFLIDLSKDGEWLLVKGVSHSLSAASIAKQQRIHKI